MNFYLPSGAVRTGLPVGFIQSNKTGEPLWQDDSVQAKKSSSTGDIHEGDGEGLRRRLSLPGLLSQGDFFLPLLLQTLFNLSPSNSDNSE